MAACSISNAVDKFHFDEREKTYLRIVNKYDKEERQLFPQLLAYKIGRASCRERVWLMV